MKSIDIVYKILVIKLNEMSVHLIIGIKKQSIYNTTYITLKICIRYIKILSN